MCRRLILITRMVLMFILIGMVTCTVKAVELEIKSPQVVPCGIAQGEEVVQRTCVRVIVRGNMYVIIFAADGLTVIAIVKVNKDNTTEVIYKSKEELNE